MQIELETKLDFDDVLIKPKRSTLESRKNVDLFRTYKGINSGREWTGIPILASNMDTVGTLAMAKAVVPYGLGVTFHKYLDQYLLGDLLFSNKEVNDKCFITTGIKDEEINKLLTWGEFKKFSNIHIDVANGYTELFVNKCRLIRESFPDAFILAGSVCTPEMVQELIINGGVDCVKVGIGSGSHCITRIKTGVGYPQLSCIVECAEAAHGLRGLVCSDGGCREVGDVCKAFGAGADFVMLGGMLAGHKESGGELSKDKKFKECYGMASQEAMSKYSKGDTDYKTAEGKKTMIPYRGEVKDTIEDILGGLRSACTYIGCDKLKDFSKRCSFIKVNRIYNTIYNQYEV